jgi:hypothetical protein
LYLKSILHLFVASRQALCYIFSFNFVIPISSIIEVEVRICTC